jgi:hypothetical protein
MDELRTVAPSFSVTVSPAAPVPVIVGLPVVTVWPFVGLVNVGAASWLATFTVLVAAADLSVPSLTCQLIVREAVLALVVEKVAASSAA